MLEQIFLYLIQNSIQASFFILAILFIRLFVKRMSKQYLCILWAFLALRLLFPIQIPSSLSLVPDIGNIQSFAATSQAASDKASDITQPSSKTDTTFTKADMDFTKPDTDSDRTDTNFTKPDMAFASQSDTVHTDTDTTILPSLSDTASIAIEAKTISTLSRIWLCGFGLLTAYGILSYIRTKFRLREAVHDTDNIWYSEHIATPFVLGLIKPRIYIPYTVGSLELPYIIDHEKAHISHFDPVSKLLGYLLLCVYWCNPLIWIAYLCFCRDLELACDERVITVLGDDERKAYSNALLTCSISKHTLLQSPLAFSEVGVKERIISILNYKKPGFWGMVSALCLCIVVCVCFWTNPKQSELPDTEKDSTESASDSESSSDASAAIDALEVIAATEFFQEIEDQSRIYWTEKLLAEQKISSSEQLYAYGNPANDALLTFGSKLEIVYTFYTLDEFHVPTLYTTRFLYERHSDSIYLLECEHIAYDNITTAAEAEGYYPLYITFFAKEDSDESIRLSSLVAKAYAKAYPTSGNNSVGNNLSAACPLTDPVTAFETLMHINGGTAEILPSNGNKECVIVYTFADGTQLGYELYAEQIENSQTLYWFPRWEYTIDNTKELRKTQAYLEQATADDLRQVTAAFTFSLYQETLPDIYSSDVFLILDEIPEKDVTLYGLCNGSGMIIQEGDTLYKLSCDWLGGYSSAPELYKYDYDKDGYEEYAIKQITGTGTGAYQEEIMILEPDSQYTFDGSLISDSYTADITDHLLTLDTGYDACTLNLTAFEADHDCTYTDIAVGDILFFEEKDGQWWLYAQTGFVRADSAAPTYDCDILLAAPVLYHADHTFTLGDISIIIDATDDSYLYATAQNRQNFNGFMLTDQSETAYRYEYFDPAEDVTITIDTTTNQGYLLHNSNRLEISSHGAFYQKSDAEYALPYLTDVTGDGIKELVLVYSYYPENYPYAVSDCLVYRLDTMEKLDFENLLQTSSAELSKTLILTPISYQEESSELTIEVFFDEGLTETHTDTDRLPAKLTVQTTPDEADRFLGQHFGYTIPLHASLTFNSYENIFTAIYMPIAPNRFYPLCVDYTWNETTKTFVQALPDMYLQK